jgi:hypothetical protein
MNKTINGEPSNLKVGVAAIRRESKEAYENQKGIPHASKMNTLSTRGLAKDKYP